MIAGKSLIRRVVDQCRQAASLEEVIVATDDLRIADHVRSFCRVEMTSSEHPSGTDRIAEVVERLECDGVVNIQGDEPLMDPSVVDVVGRGLAEAPMTTAAVRMVDPHDYLNPNVTKVVVGQLGQALYFSRRTIPFFRDAAEVTEAEQLRAFPFLKHLGIYGYRRETLLQLVRWPVSPLEGMEKLEQLRALEHGIPIRVSTVDYESIGVDTPEDVIRVEERLKLA